jgi:hypothetical protein
VNGSPFCHPHTRSSISLPRERQNQLRASVSKARSSRHPLLVA